MKQLFLSLSILFISVSGAEEAPALLKNFLTQDVEVKAEVVVVNPPAEMNQYVAKINEAVKKDMEWFIAYSKTAKAGVPLPYDPKLGLNKQEYDAYIELWNKRQFQVIDEISITLKKGSDNRWNLFCTNSASMISSLRYDDKENNWKSTNGILTKKEDINADAQGILGAWSGAEWAFVEDTSLSKVKENFAVGKTADGKYHLLVYRAQEVTPTGTRVLDKSIVVRVPTKTAVLAKPQK